MRFKKEKIEALERGDRIQRKMEKAFARKETKEIDRYMEAFIKEDRKELKRFEKEFGKI